ncbi:MAG: sulfurtransferase complex subunit TusB [Pseudomonadota bacterium]
MPTLFTVNQSPQNFDDRLLKIMTEKDAIVLIENGVLHSCQDEFFKLFTHAKITSNNPKIYVIDSDLSLRGLQRSIYPEIKHISYADFVELCLQFDNVTAW